eukprot:TRINITY_DN5222_c0_g1_i8.p1 TRINITY_DN5222_c0_g1~~TRINITY_DN5222_c0_g1_i8.p1  ORF type:complete len:669 (+),score=103.92 TRINITY_DN5222_c0_g1_i8:55-2061(+)
MSNNIPFLDDQQELDYYSNVVRDWICGCLREQFSGTLQEYLLDGSVLCRLGNTHLPDSIPRFHVNTNVKARQLENIDKFTMSLQRFYGFTQVQLFQCDDIFKGNMKGVVAVLLEYMAKTEGKKTSSSNSQKVTPLSGIVNALPKFTSPSATSKFGQSITNVTTTASTSTTTATITGTLVGSHIRTSSNASTSMISTSLSIHTPTLIAVQEETSPPLTNHTDTTTFPATTAVTPATVLATTVSTTPTKSVVPDTGMTKTSSDVLSIISPRGRRKTNSQALVQTKSTREEPQITTTLKSGGKWRNEYQLVKNLLNSGILMEIKQLIAGKVISPGDTLYDAARCVKNRAYNALPYVIIQPLCSKDVVVALSFATFNGLKVSVKSGGYSIAGHCVLSNTVLLDMSLMKNIHVSPELKVVTVQSGARWIDVLRATSPSTVVGPYDSSIGMGVLLGGGFGALLNSHGLSIDRVISMEVVTSSGQICNCNQTNDNDLFYAIRGCGGMSFGIITSFTLEMVDDIPPKIYSSRKLWLLGDAKTILMHHRNVMLGFSNRNIAMITTISRGKIKLEHLYYGEPTVAEEKISLLFPPNLKPSKESTTITTYLTWCLDHCSSDTGDKFFAKSYLVENFDEECVDIIIGLSSQYPEGGECRFTIEWLYGAVVEDVSKLYVKC